MKRRVLLSVAAFFLVVWALATALVHGSLFYAVSNPRPAPIEPQTNLAALQGRAVELRGSAEHAGRATFRRYGVTSFYAPIEGFDGRLIVKTEAPMRMAEPRQQRFVGRLMPFEASAFSSKVARELRKAGFEPPPGASLLADGELPSTFLPMLVLFVPVTLLWLVVLVLVGHAVLNGRRGDRRDA